MRVGGHRIALFAGAGIFVAATVLAQARGKHPAKPAHPAGHAAAHAAHGTKTARPASSTASASVDSADAGAEKPAASATTAPKERTTKAAKEPGGDAGVLVSEKGDGGTKQFKFGEVDIEGRLKAPELVYFLRRVRAEFAAGDLGHRSFLPELSETKNDPHF